MKRPIVNRRIALMSLVVVLTAFAMPGVGYGQGNSPSVTASTTSPLTEATLDGSVVTLTLSSGVYASSIFDVRRGVSVSGIAGVSVGTFGVQRVNDTKVTVELTFNGDFDEDGTLTFTVGAGAIASYNGAALTAELSVSAGMESVTASTTSPLTETTLNGSVVTLTLTGGAYARSFFDVRDGVSVSGIAGVSVGTFGIERVSDTKVTVELDFNGDFDEDGTLTFTVGAGAIANYSGARLTAQLPVSAGMESVTASTTSPLTEATLNGSVVTLTLAGGVYASSIFDVRDGVSVSGIAGVSVGTFGVRRVSDTKVTVELDFNGDIDADGTLTFTVGAGALANYSGARLTAQLPVSAGMESVTASTVSPLTEATLNGGVVTLTLTGGAYASSIFDVRRGVTVSGITGVSVETFGITRVSDTKVTVELTFNGDIDADGTLTFTVGAGALANYSGPALTDQLPVTASMESMTATTVSPLTEATLNGGVVTLTLTGGAYASSIFDVRRGVTVSGITGVSVETFGITRVSDTKVTVELTFNGDIDADGTLTFTVGAGALANYSGPALTDQLPVTASMESMTATTVSPLTEATLNGGVVTLTLTGGRYASSIFDVRRGVTVSGIAGVSVGTFGITRVSDTKVTVALTFNRDIDADGTLTFTVGAGAIANYSGPALTDQVSVTALEETVVATTPQSLTEATLNGSVVTLTLTGRSYASSIFDVRRAVTVSGITGVSVGSFGIQRASDTKVTVTLTYNGDIDADGTLTFTVGAGAISNYSGAALTAQLPVSAGMESVTASTTSPLTEATLNGGVVTLTLTGGAYASSIFDVRRGVSVSGIAGVSVGTFGITRVSDTKVTVELTFNGDIDADGTLTFTVGAGAIANYNGDPLLATLPVTAESGGGTNQVPTFTEGASATRSFAENTGAGQNIGNPVSAADSDGGTLTYSLEGTDASSFTLVSSSGQLQTRTGVTYDFEVKNRYQATVRVSDGQGGSVTIGVRINLTDVGEPQANPVLYWTDAGKDKIQRANLDGSNVEDLVDSADGLDGPVGITLDVAGGKMYWTEWEKDKIRRANLDGSNVENLITSGLHTPVWMALDVPGGKIYWTDWGTDRIQRANLEGSNVEDLVTRGLNSPGGLALDVANGKMYWTDSFWHKIQRANLDGSNVEDLITSGLGGPSGLALDVANGKMYWTELNRNRIQRANLDGSNIEDLVTRGLGKPNELVLDLAGGKMYWTNRDFSKIQRANLDGSNIEDLVTSADGLSDPTALALAVAGQVPTFNEGASATRSFAENAGAGQNIGNPVSATDSDGGTLTYSLEGTDAASFVLVPTSGQLQTRAGITYDFEVKNRYEVTVRVSDGQSGSTTIDVTINLTDVSEPQARPELYWTDLGTHKIQRADLDGSNVEDLVTRGLGTPVGLAVDVSAGKMYWPDMRTKKIQRSDLDGSNVEDLVTSGLHTPVWMALDVSGGKMYWTDWGTDRIQRANLDGSNVENLVVAGGLNSPAGLVLDVSAGKMYWTDSSADKIQRADLDGSNVEDLITSGFGSPSGLALDIASGKMYWTDRETGEIQRADLDGSNIEDVITRGLDKPIELDLDLSAGKMYWTDLDTDKIQRANLDGSSVEDLVTRADGLDNPFGLALATPTAPTPPAPLGRCATGSAVQNPAANPWLVSDCNALLDARDTLVGTATLNWSENTLISTWDGVTLSGTPQRVTNLRLWNESLNGTIPAELSRLTGLEALYLAFNQLTGTIPAELGTMTSLTHLGLMNNRLTGRIPAELRNLTNLGQFALQHNQLTGTIPTWLGDLPRLKILNLQGNRLTGPIPAELGRLSELWQLLIFGNQLTGTIPAELGNLGLLQEVRLDDNKLTGSIPSTFSSLTRLTLLYLAGNTLTGCIPPELRDILGNDLDKLNLSDCTGSQGQVTADFNDDGIVNFADFFDFVDAFGSTDAKFDLDGSGTVDFADFFEFVDAFGTSG